jgi:hypothetical protein
MQPVRFDAFVRSLAESGSRRRIIRGLLGALGLGTLTRGTAAASAGQFGCDSDSDCSGIGEICFNGFCNCRAGLTACFALCVDTFTSHSHCGWCFHSCAPDQQCIAGVCIGGSGAASTPVLDPTPTVPSVPEPSAEPEGVTFEPIAIASGLTLPSPADIIAVRFRIEPGAVLPLEASDPTGGMLIVESGTFTIRLDTAWAISRSGSLTAAFATAEASGTYTPADEQIASGDEATLGAGDAAYIPGSITGEIRNDGAEPAAGLVVLIGPTEAMTEATPTP